MGNASIIPGLVVLNNLLEELCLILDYNLDDGCTSFRSVFSLLDLIVHKTFDIAITLHTHLKMKWFKQIKYGHIDKIRGLRCGQGVSQCGQRGQKLTEFFYCGRANHVKNFSAHLNAS